jgi:hypothetical protein
LPPRLIFKRQPERKAVGAKRRPKPCCLFGFTMLWQANKTKKAKNKKNVTLYD